MAQYTLAPFWLRFNYTVEGLNHTHNVAVKATPENDTGPYQLVTKDDSNVSVVSGATAYATALTNLMSSADMVITTYELWRQLPSDESPIFVQSGTLNFSGLQGAGSKLGSQGTLTFRDAKGKGFRTVVLDQPMAALQQIELGDFTANLNTFVAYVIDADSIVRSRAGNPISQALRYSISYNDSLTRKRFNVS